MTTTTAPVPLTQQAALLLLDDAWEALDRAVAERFECPDCKAAGTGWCEPDNCLFLAAEEIGRAKAQIRACHSDEQAREIVTGVMDRLSDKTRFGDASEVAFFGVAGGAR